MDPAIRADELLRHTEFLRRLARGLIADEQAAEDLVQEAWVRAIERPPSEKATLRSWLATVVRNLAVNRHRGESRRAHREEAAARDDRQPPHTDSIERLELERKILDLIQGQPEERRDALVMRYYEGLAPKAIAARLGVPVKTIKTRLSRGLADLRAQLDRAHEGGRDHWVAALLPLAAPVGAPPIVEAGEGVAESFAESIARGAQRVALGRVAAGVAAVALGVVVVRELAGDEERIVPTRTFAESSDVTAPPVEVASVPSVVDALERAEAGERVALAGEEAATPAAATGGVEIEMVWSDGTPAAGVGFALVRWDGIAPTERYRQGRADEHGIARIGGVPTGTAFFFDDRDALEVGGGDRLELDIVAGETIEETVTLRPGLDVIGEVVDANGRPVAGAQIWIDGSFSWSAAAVATHSDANGAFRLRDVGPERELGASTPDRLPSPFLPVGEQEEQDQGVRRVRLVLGERAASLHGRVVGPEGEPVAGAVVLAGEVDRHTLRLDDGARGTAFGTVRATTGERGEFVYPAGLSPGTAPVVATAPGYPIWEGEVAIEGSGEATLSIRLEHGASLRGRVLDPRGEPVPGARVTAARETRGGWFRHALPRPRTKTDENGAFVLTHIAPGEQSIHASTVSGELGRVNVDLSFAPNEERSHDLVLSLGETITGRLLDTSGNPLADWRINAQPVGCSWYPRHAKSDANGSFLLPNLGACPHRLAIRAPDDPFGTRLELPSVEPGSHDLELIVQNAAAADAFVVGALRRSDGSVPSDCSLVLWDVDDGIGRFVDLDEAGGFRAGPLIPSVYRLQATRGSTVLAQSEAFALEQGATHDAGELRIGPLGRVEIVPVGAELPRSFQLQVLREDGFGVWLEPGELLSDPLHAGEWIVTGSGGGQCVRPTRVTVIEGETVEVEVEPEPIVEFPLAIHADRDWAQLEVEVFDESGGRLERRRYGNHDVASGAKRLSLEVPFGWTRVEISTEDGSKASVELEISIESMLQARSTGGHPVELR